MPSFFKRIVRRLSGSRSLEAGANGRRWASTGTITSLNNEIQARNATIRSRTAQFARNNAHVAVGVNVLVSNIVGPGIVPSSQHPDPAMQKRLQDLWMRWIDRCDVEGAGDFYALQALVVRQMVEAGESFARMASDGRWRTEIPLKLQVIHPSQVPMNALGMSFSPQIRAGVEFSADGQRRVAYHVLPQRPDDFFQPLGSLWTPIRVPAEDICHVFDRLEPGQVRGLSWLAPILLMINELDQLQDAALVRAKLGNLICAGLIGPEAEQGFAATGTQDGAVLGVTMEPGSILPFAHGSNIEWFEPKESAHYTEFVRTHLRAVAAGLGIPYELLTGDLAEVNYSSIRAGLLEFRKKLEHWQHSVVVYRLCRPVWDRFITVGVLSGAIDLSAYTRNPVAFHAVEWLPPRQEWVDPKKDLEAETGAIEAGLMSRTQALASRGLDINRVRAEIAAERKADAEAGLDFTAKPKATVTVEQPADDDETSARRQRRAA